MGLQFSGFSFSKLSLRQRGISGDNIASMALENARYFPRPVVIYGYDDPVSGQLDATAIRALQPGVPAPDAFISRAAAAAIADFNLLSPQLKLQVHRQVFGGGDEVSIPLPPELAEAGRLH